MALSQLDYRKIANMYGNGKRWPLPAAPSSDNLPFFSGATYDSIEGPFHINCKEAGVMKAEVEPGERPASPPRDANPTGSNSGRTTPKKSRPPPKRTSLGLGYR